MRLSLLLTVGFVLAMASLACKSVAQTANTGGATPKSSSPISKLHFPEPWLDPPDLIEAMEVRKVPNSPAGEFLFAALPDGDNDFAHEVDKTMYRPRYGDHMFAVNFSAGLQVRVVTREEWDSGSRIATKPKLVFHKGNDEASGQIEYRQKRYSKVGKYWSHALLSPSGRWLAVFSYNGEKPPPDFFHFISGADPREGDVFWQIYDTATGQKVFEWEAKNVKGPTHLNGPGIWLEDKYFLFPDDEPAQNFNVATLPPFTPEINPVTVQLPPRRDATSKPLPAGARHEVWGSVVGLTKEQAANLTVPKETELSEVRLSRQIFPQELLLAISEETENRRVSRPRPRDGYSEYQGTRDGDSEYQLRVISQYYYALSLDSPTQVRIVSKEEWERGQTVWNHRSTTPEEPVEETVKSNLPPYRRFPKTATTWGSPPVLHANDWIAIFSYSQQDRSHMAGTMFVDVYNARLGEKLLSTELPFTVAPDELFKQALWIDGGYILMPLNSSLDSFAFWRLP